MRIRLQELTPAQWKAEAVASESEVKYLHQVSSNTWFIIMKENYTSEDCGRDAPRRGHISISG